MNHITITGRVATDLVRRETDKGVVVSFRLASGKAGEGGGRLWIDIDTWGNLAGTCYQHLAKGRRIVISGRLAQPQWINRQTGEKHERFVIVADQVEFMDSRSAPSS